MHLGTMQADSVGSVVYSTSFSFLSCSPTPLLPSPEATPPPTPHLSGIGEYGRCLTGTLGYIPPECFDDGIASVEADVFASGVVAIQLLLKRNLRYCNLFFCPVRCFYQRVVIHVQHPRRSLSVSPVWSIFIRPPLIGQSTSHFLFV